MLINCGLRERWGCIWNITLPLSFCLFRPICIKFVTEDVYKTSFSNCNFNENLCCEGHTVRKGVNKFLYVYSTLIFQFGFNSVYDICTKCCCVFVSFMKIGAEKTAISFIRNCMCCDNWYRYERKESLGKFCVHHLKSCSPIQIKSDRVLVTSQSLLITVRILRPQLLICCYKTALCCLRYNFVEATEQRAIRLFAWLKKIIRIKFGAQSSE